ncbi:hypothetical protein ACFCV3_41640 [Kribbella sp. NPDC056345]|uniref:hypothetical protein n=1 Tax=Kribbella sp. NPDC056345 TaxID=3345789 RepID=UPI0035DCD070
MPKNHARKNQLAALKTQLGVKHVDAIALLDHPDTDDRDALEEILSVYVDVTTYKDAVAVLEDKRNDPANRVICHTCGWTASMACPECPGGCACYNGRCLGWRHDDWMGADQEPSDAYYTCPECGGDTRSGYDCSCADRCSDCGSLHPGQNCDAPARP